MTPPRSPAGSRRDFFKVTASVVAGSALDPLSLAGQPIPVSPDASQTNLSVDARADTAADTGAPARATANGAERVFSGDHLTQVAFPMGGIGGGMICLEGTGMLSHVSLRHNPDLLNEPCMFAAIAVKPSKGTGAPVARVLEGPIPSWKIFGRPDSGGGNGKTSYGLPRFAKASFSSRFPFGTVALTDDTLPVSAKITGWSPFIPGNADDSSLPVAALEYTITNTTNHPISAVFSFNARNFMGDTIRTADGGFAFGESAAEHRTDGFQASVSDPAVKVNHAWFRGGWWDGLTMMWKDVASGAAYDRPPVADGRPAEGATLFVPFELAPHASKTIPLRLSWFVGTSDLRWGFDLPGTTDRSTYVPWYAGKFADLAAVSAYWRDNYKSLRDRTSTFTKTFYDTTLPPEVVEAIAANLSILKSPTTLRQTDGRLWVWEGCNDKKGSCAGSCTHVWNYAQAFPHLFPSLERTVRESELIDSLDEKGHQMYRTALPIRPQQHFFLPAADGQPGSIMRVYREWRISGDTEWMRKLWPNVQRSLNYCIETWDPKHTGWIVMSHHNTYDIEFVGGDGMCTSFYLGALHAAVVMGTALNANVSLYKELYAKGRPRAESELFNGEYFVQRVDRTIPQLEDPDEPTSPEGKVLEQAEGPKYQYGSGCLSDGVIGAWMGLVCGMGMDDVLDPKKVKQHALSVHRYNFKRSLLEHANMQRSGFGCGTDAGMLLCTWPHGNKPSLPFVYSDEVWTGVEYQVASHLMFLGETAKGLDIVRAARARYDGRVRNPYDEYEAGHFYGRALSSYAMIQALSGARYDAVDKTLYLHPTVRGDFRAFLSTNTGYGTVGVRHGKPFLDVVSGTIDIRHIDYRAA